MARYALWAYAFFFMSSVAAASAAPPKEGAAAAQPLNEADQATPTDGYVHKWQKMPDISGKMLPSGDHATIHGKSGDIIVAVFISSWCEPCQRMMADVMKLEKKYQKLNTRFVYIFANDTAPDAQAFMREYGMKSAFLGDSKLLQEFKDPEAPALIVGDKKGFVVGVMQKATPKQLENLGELLKYLTVI